MTTHLALTMPRTDETSALLVNWLTRTITPLALDAARLPEHADKLRNLPTITAEHVTRPTRLRRHACATREAADAVMETFIEWPHGAPVKRFIDVVDKPVLDAMNLARRVTPGSRAGWYAYFACDESIRCVQQRGEPVGPLLNRFEADYDRLCAAIFLDVQGTSVGAAP